MALEKLLAGEESLENYSNEQIDDLSKEVLVLPENDKKESIKKIIRFFAIDKDREEGINGRILYFISIPEISEIVQALKKEALS